MTIKKRILQATFDEAVQENIDTFSMSPEEAVKAAVDEFEMQGVDLSNIIKTSSGGDLQEHPIMLATKALQEATDRSDTGQADESLRRLQQLVSPEGQAELQAVVVACGTVPTLIASAETLHTDSPAVLQLCLEVLANCLASDDSRAAFAEADGAALLHLVLSGQPGSLSEVVGTAAAAARAAATRDEANKKGMVKSQVADDLVGQIGLKELPANIAAECCRALRAVTTMDDPRPIAPETFNHARHIAAVGAAPALLGLLRRDEGADTNLTEAALSALRPVAANDQICQEIAEAGGVDLVIAMFSKPESPLPPHVARAAIALLRQLAGSDANKRQIVASGGLKLALRLVREQPEELKLVEQAMGLFSSLMLRNPEVALQAYELGCADVMLDVLQDANITAPVARQTSQAVRILVSRNPDLRAVLREKDFGPALKAVRKRHFAACRDVASAAMRDLGMDDYNVMEAL